MSVLCSVPPQNKRQSPHNGLWGPFPSIIYPLVCHFSLSFLTISLSSLTHATPALDFHPDTPNMLPPQGLCMCCSLCLEYSGYLHDSFSCKLVTGHTLIILSSLPFPQHFLSFPALYFFCNTHSLLHLVLFVSCPRPPLRKSCFIFCSPST